MWTVGLLTAFGVIAMLFLGKRREKNKAQKLEDRLLQSRKNLRFNKVDFATFALLPEPVARYFRYALTDGQPIVIVMRMQQNGVLRTNTITDKWITFAASQLVVPSAPGFIWNAKMTMPFKTHVGVLDSYIAGVGSGRVNFLSAIEMATATGAKELNSGALIRYLAEAVWYPTALLPESGMTWTAIDDNAALATLVDGDTTVSLEFRFNAIGEVASIYSPDRFRSLDGGYTKMPWEGYFRNYTTQSGIKVPTYGEVGWYELGVLQLVWKGNITKIQFEL